MAAEPSLTTIIEKSREAIRSMIERQIAARATEMNGGRRLKRLKTHYPLQWE